MNFKVYNKDSYIGIESIQSIARGVFYGGIDNLIFLPSTEKLDCKGIEIFFGDLVTGEYENLINDPIEIEGEIVWDKIAAAFLFKIDDTLRLTLAGHAVKNLKVIKNKYDNS